MSFDGKVALITGASSGIGAETARHLAKLGAKVAIVGRNEKRLNAVAEEIRNSGSPSPLPVIADVTKDAERIVKETIKHFGKLDILANVAGIYREDNTLTMSEFDNVFTTNVRSVIDLTKLCVPHLEKTKGNVVNVSSTLGLKANKKCVSHCMAKAAINQYTKCAALDLASKGIRVNAITPGVTRTSILEPHGYSADDLEKHYAKSVSEFLLGRVGEVTDCSVAIAFLANEKTASFLTGVLLPVEGGHLLV